MKTKTSVAILLVIFGLMSMSCNKEKLFQQPTIEVLGYELKGLPTDSAHIDVNIKLTSTDKRSVHLADVDYQVNIEGYLSGVEKCDIDKDIEPDSSLEMTLPLTLATDDAIQLLSMLDKGQSLDYTVTGTFHVDDPFYNLLDFPINISGSAKVEVGFEEYFEQPDVNVDSVVTSYVTTEINGIPTSYTFNMRVYTTVTNKDNRSAVIDEIEYTPTIEGKTAAKGYYSDTHTEDFSIEAGASDTVSFPLTLSFGATDGAVFLSKLMDGYADYIVEGTFHTIKVDGEAADFKLPLYVEGSAPISVIQVK